MPLKIKWKVAIVVQQDGNHAWEYADLELALLAQPRFENVEYRLFYYDELSQTASVKELWANPGGAVLQTVEPAAKVHIYDLKALTDYFSSVFKPEPGIVSRYMVIVWAHGTGLGYVGNISFDANAPDYFEGMDLLGSESVVKEKMPQYNQALKHFVFLRSHLSMKAHPMELMEEFLHQDKIRLSANDMTVLDGRLRIITAGQLNSIFQRALPDRKKIDVLITNTCYTQMLETGYALKDSVSMLISPETTIPFNGFNYNALFRNMEKRPELDLKEIALNVRNNFTKKYTTEPFKSTFRIMRPYPYSLMDEVSFSANLLEPYQEFMDSFFIDLARKFWQAVDPQRPDEALKAQILAARNRCVGVAPANSSDYSIVDFTHFFEGFVGGCQKARITGWEEPLARYAALTGKIRMAWYPATGRAQYSERQPSRSPHYLSIFFPDGVTSSHMNHYLAAVYLKKSTAQAFPIKKTKWPDFVDRMINFWINLRLSNGK